MTEFQKLCKTNFDPGSVLGDIRTEALHRFQTRAVLTVLRNVSDEVIYSMILSLLTSIKAPNSTPLFSSEEEKEEGFLTMRAAWVAGIDYILENKQ